MNYQNVVSNPKFIFWMNVVRFLVLLIAFLILFILFKNISEVKLLASDVCQICMNKTGAICFQSGFN